MFNVDTISIGMNLEDRKTEIKNVLGRIREVTDYNYVRTVNDKIKIKLHLDDENKKKLQKVIAMNQMARELFFRFNKDYWSKKLDITRYGRDGNYSFFYNETRHTLTIHLQHSLIEEFTAEEIIENTKQELMDYFGLTIQELEPLTLRRIDYYCDYKYRDDVELQVIKNIITKITEQFYTYRKEITDKPEKYVVKYLALKGNSKKYQDDKFIISERTIVDWEEDDEYEV